MISFHGVSSEDVRVIVEHYPTRPVPARKHERYSVPGRSGDILQMEEAWENVTQPYDIYISAEGPGLPIIAEKAVQWLMAEGYQRLEDEYDPNTYRMAAYLGPVDLQNILNDFGRATIEFDCAPQRFLKSGALLRQAENNSELINPTIYTALPLIIVQGAGAGTLTIAGRALELDDCDNVTLDCAEEEAYRGTENMNSAVGGLYPRLTRGRSAVSWTGGISEVQIAPRWYVI